MASHETLKRIVNNGSNLILCSGIDVRVLEELAALAVQSGSKLTVTTGTRKDVIEQLSDKYKGAITFIDGLHIFQNDK